MGSPKQESSCATAVWCIQMRCIWALADLRCFHRSRKTRTENLANAGLEWLYRLLSQPSRIKRQLRFCVIYAGITPATSDFPLFVKHGVVTPSPVCFFITQSIQIFMLYLPFLLNYENIRNTRCTQTITGNTGKHANTTRGFMADTNQSYSVGWKLDISNSSPWGHHWRRPVYGGRQYPEMGRAIVLLAYIIAGLFVFFIMRSMAKCCSSNRLPVRSPFMRIVIEPVFWLSHRLVLLVYVDGGGISEITAIGVYVQFWFPEMARGYPH